MNNSNSLHHQGLRIGLAALAIAAAGGFATTAFAQDDHEHFIGEVVTEAPPPPQVEQEGSPPNPGYVWEQGWWAWEDGRHVWHPGHWEAPRPGYSWSPTVWVHEGDGWHLREGYWVRR